MKESFKVELWSIWLSGLVLIGLSLYATQRLPLHNKDHSRITISNLNNNVASDSTGLRITIFTAPKPFKGSTGTKQSLAIQSWLALSPNVGVVLFSKDPSVASFSGAFGSRVLVDTNIDFTFLGTPFLHSMIARSHSFTSDIYVIVDPETVILSGFISTLNHAYELDHDWLLVASSQNVSHFPFHLDNSGKHWLLDNGEHVKIHEIQKMLQQNWQGNQCYTSMIIAWNNNDAPLHNGVLPPFLYNKGIHNNWLIHEAMSSEFRFVFDATLTITSFHLNGDQDIENREWEYIGNSHLGAHYGSFFFSEANYSSIPKLFKCYKQYIILDTDKNIVYPIRHSRKMNLWKENIFSSWLEKNTMHCIACLKSQIIRILDCSLKGQMKTSEPLEIPFSLESLLSISADETKTIVLTTAGFSYKDMLMSWVCRLRKLSIENFIVCALDQETYQFSILQGIPVFKDPLVPSNISFDDCHFGTKCFQRVTKVKSRMVLKILKLGYNVLLSDVDTYWFKNPIPLLQSFGPAVLAAQSDEFNKKGPINLPRRLNSGFYYAHSDGQTIAAMEKVVRHAQTSSLSEQPSFYDMLCGTGGSNRVDDNRCVESETNMTVYFLDRDLFPNGAYQDLWQKKNVSAACLKKGCFIIHNNWISGRLKKLERQVMSDRLQNFRLQAMLKRVVHKLGLVEETKKDYKKKNKAKGSKASSELTSRSSELFVKIKHVGGQKDLYKHAVPVSKLMRKHHGMCIALPQVFKDPHNAVLNEGEVLQPGHKYILISFKDVDKLKRKFPAQGKTSRANGVVAVEKMDKKAGSPSGHKLKAQNGVAGRKTHDEITFTKENGNMKMPNGFAGQKKLETKTILSPSGKCNKGQAKVANGLVDDEEEIVDTMEDGSQGGDEEEQSLFSSARDFYVPKEKRSARPCSRRKGLKGRSPFVPPLPRGRSYRSMGWQPSLPSVKELSP